MAILIVSEAGSSTAGVSVLQTDITRSFRVG
jgi:hypothetical protein